MKICHITTAHKRYDVRIFLKECISLAKEGHKVYLIVNDSQKDQQIEGVNILSINNSKTGRITRFFSHSFRKKVFKIAKRVDADIYHLHDPELLKLGMKLKKEGHRIVYDSHEDVPRQILAKEWIPKWMRPLISKKYEKYENKKIKKFDAVIVPTPHIKERFKKSHPHVYMVCNYPSLKETNFSADKYNNVNSPIYIGGLSHSRGILQIAEASLIAKTGLTLFGEFYNSKFKEKVLKTYSHIKFRGMIDRKNIFPELEKSSMGLVTLLYTPNHYRAYPIKLFEYMAAGIPVIASNFPIYKEIIEENQCGICVDPTNIKAISDAILRIQKDKKYADFLRKNGYKAVIDKFNWESQVVKLLSCYNEIY